MTELVIKAGFVILLIIVGIILYKIGNAIWGKTNRGGKRLVLFAIGLGAIAMSVAMFCCIDFKSPKELFLLCLAAVFGVAGLWVLLVSLFSKPKELDKKFDNIIDSL